MKQYYTLVQAFTPTGRSLGEYLDQQGILYTLGADLYEELKKYGYINSSSYTISGYTIDGKILKTYKALIDEHELTAIKLSVDGVDIIRNRFSLNLLNKVRSYFSWILD
jgi:hypothetical protein